MAYILPTPDTELRFTAYLPQRALPYGPAIVEACRSRDVDPFIVFGLGDRESVWGNALKQLTGDWGVRTWTSSQIAAFPHVVKLDKAPDAQGRWRVLPEDGLGWGRGLMQLDFVDQYDWLATHDWRSPVLNIARGVDVLLSKLAFFSSKVPAPNVSDGAAVVVNDWFASRFQVMKGQYEDPRPLIGGVLENVSIAAYNAAKENVLRMLVAGGMERVDEVTTERDYSRDVRSRAEAQRVQFMQDA